MEQQLEILNPTTRFSNRVENYVKYRPSYPDAIIPFLEEHIGLQPFFKIADIGSGTGLFSELFLKAGYKVTGIEPNEGMRRESEKRLGKHIGFSSRAHKAEQTGLRNHSVDLITVAQAFHWMDAEATRKEFTRILKPDGHIVLAWNIRLKNTQFLREYDALKQEFGIDHQHIRQADEELIRSFYFPQTVIRKNFENRQDLSFDALKGQLLSSSYIPLPGHPRYEEMIAQLVALFVKCNEKGFVKMEFETKIFFT